jgi:cytochrome c-type biogenesis protein CcmE
MAVDGFSSGRRRSRSKKRQRMLLVVGALVVLGFAVFLVLRAFEDNLVFFFTPTDVEEGKVKAGQQFRLGGLVEMGSLQKTEGSLEITFKVTDGDKTLPVTFEGFLPDLFREGQGVVTEGKLSTDGLFVAETVLAKHDENYMPPEVAESLKEKGLWKHGGGEVDTVAPKTPSTTTAPSTTTKREEK